MADPNVNEVKRRQLWPPPTSSLHRPWPVRPPFPAVLISPRPSRSCPPASSPPPSGCPACPLPGLTTSTVSSLRNFARPSGRSHLARAAAANSAEVRAAEKKKPRFPRTLARRLLGVRRQIGAPPGRCLPDAPPPGPAHPCLPHLSQARPIALPTFLVASALLNSSEKFNLLAPVMFVLLTLYAL